MSAYMFFNVSELTDETKMEEYRRQVFSTVEQFGGRYLIIGGDRTVLEGESGLAFPVLIEFESAEQANRWYNSKEYRDILQLRLQSTKGNLVLIEGYEPV